MLGPWILKLRHNKSFVLETEGYSLLTTDFGEESPNSILFLARDRVMGLSSH